MKSEHRHDLETNLLAKKLATWIEALRPYGSAAFGTALVIAIGVIGFSYFSGSSSARQGQAWSSYNQAIEGWIPDLEKLRLSAEEHAGTTMQRWADMTWADGHVWMAARDYIHNRAAALEALNRASGTYRNLIEESNDERLQSRAHFGLARVYELRGELDKAKEEYLAVRGGFEQLAKSRAEALDDPETKDASAWLATAQAPRRSTPTGPGTPGQRPDFSVGGLDIPSQGDAGAEDAPASVDDLFRGFELPDVPEDRYEADGESANAAESDAEQPATDAATEDPPQDQSGEQ
jgi:predicted negative regulator of RcsB-dependent stress response